MVNLFFDLYVFNSGKEVREYLDRHKIKIGIWEGQPIADQIKCIDCENVPTFFA